MPLAPRSFLYAADEATVDDMDGYADDVVELLEALDVHDVVLVGHSVSAMISVIASLRATERVGALVLIGPSHFVPFEGVAAWPRGAFATPLGELRIADEDVRALVAATDVISTLRRVTWVRSISIGAT